MDYATAAADAPGHLAGAPVRAGPRGYEGMAPGAGGSLGTGPGLGRGTGSGPRQRYARAPNGAAPNHDAGSNPAAAVMTNPDGTPLSDRDRASTGARTASPAAQAATRALPKRR